MYRIEKYTLTRFTVELDRLIGDSQISTKQLSMGTLELEDNMGHVGTGFFHTVTMPLPSLAELEVRFQRELADDLIGTNPFSWTNRLKRPRGGMSNPQSLIRALSKLCGIFRGKSWICRFISY